MGVTVGVGRGGVTVGVGSGSPTRLPPRDASGLRLDRIAEGTGGGASGASCGIWRTLSRSGSDAAGAPGCAGSALTFLPRPDCDLLP